MTTSALNTETLPNGLEVAQASLTDFIESTRAELCEQATGLLAPQYTPDRHRDAAQTLQQLRGRAFLSAQIDAAAAGALALTQYSAVYGVGEQGCGKSQISLGVAALSKAQRVLILTPPHLVTNWRDNEVKAVWPGANVMILERPSDVERFAELPTPAIAILSRETAKLGPIRIPSIRTRLGLIPVQTENPNEQQLQWGNILSCPHCGTYLQDRKSQPLTATTADQMPAACPSCHESLWTIRHSKIHGGTAPRRYPLAKYILRYHRGLFDLLIADELHEYHGNDTWQGLAMAHLALACKKTLGLTGTIFSGYSSSVFPLLWRTHEEIQGQYRYNGINSWITEYGLWDKTTRILPSDQQPKAGKAPKPKVKTQVRERAGASPALLIPFLDRTVFIRLSDLHVNLPPYSEQVLTAEMHPEQRLAYAQLQTSLTGAITSALGQKDWQKLSLYTTALMTWPDRCWVAEPAKNHHLFTESGLPLPPVLGHTQTYPKERLLLELIHREKAAGRKVLVYATHTGIRDITARLNLLCQQNGLRTDVLTAAVSPRHRLDWITSRAKDLDAVICQPKLVSTGLTLNQFPTIVFMEPEYSIFTLRQASRRSWRLGQDKDVRVYFMTYLHTAQEQAWTLIARKLKASLLIEGDLDQTADGLATYRQEGDFLAELAQHITKNQDASQDSLQQLFRQCQELDGTAMFAPAEPVVIPVTQDIITPPAALINEPVDDAIQAVLNDFRSPLVEWCESLQLCLFNPADIRNPEAPKRKRRVG